MVKTKSSPYYSAACEVSALCGGATRELALRDAQNILLSCGAISYCVDQYLERPASARAYLSRLSLSDARPLERLMFESEASVRSLLESFELA